MKLWIDDVRPAPEGYIWCRSTNESLRFIRVHISEIEHIDIDHDAGDFAKEGGDFIEVLKELERLSRKTFKQNGIVFHNFWHFRCSVMTFHIHSMNPVGVANMRAIIERNGWKEIK